MTSTANDDAPKRATAARIYDYMLGGTHNFPADREAAQALLQAAPQAPAIARTNRAFLRRAVRYLSEAGVRQFLDIGSGIPTAGNVHEVAPEANVVYVDLDPDAVSESLEILEGNPRATAIRGDLREAQSILDHPEVKQLIDFDQPVGLLLVSVLHFVDDRAVPAVHQLVAALAPGSHLVISHGVTVEDHTDEAAAKSVYRSTTTTPLTARTRADVEGFFAGCDLVEPGLVWLSQWRPAPDDPADFADDPRGSVILAGVGQRR